MMHRVKILILSVILSGFSSINLFAMKSATRTVGPAVARFASQQARRGLSSVKRIALPSPMTGLNRFNSGLINSECRLKNEYLKNKKLVLPSLHQRWYASEPNQKHDFLIIQRAEHAYRNKQPDYDTTINFLIDKKRDDLLSQIYHATGDAKLKKYSTFEKPNKKNQVFDGKSLGIHFSAQDFAYDGSESSAEANLKRVFKSILAPPLERLGKEISLDMSNRLKVYIGTDNEVLPTKTLKEWFDFKTGRRLSIEYYLKVANYLINNIHLGFNGELNEDTFEQLLSKYIRINEPSRGVKKKEKFFDELSDYKDSYSPYKPFFISKIQDTMFNFLVEHDLVFKNEAMSFSRLVAEKLIKEGAIEALWRKDRSHFLREFERVLNRLRNSKPKLGSTSGSYKADLIDRTNQK